MSAHARKIRSFETSLMKTSSTWYQRSCDYYIQIDEHHLRSPTPPSAEIGTFHQYNFACFHPPRLCVVVLLRKPKTQFGAITHVQFPPVFEKFLSILGIFSFDLTWIFSAACLAAGVDFHDKLL